MDYYFYRHSLKFMYTLLEIKSHGFYKFYKKNNTFYHSYYDEYIDKDIYCDTCDNANYYNEFHDNYNDKLYGDYDDWEDYIDSVYN